MAQCFPNFHWITVQRWKIETAIKWIFVVNGILGIIAPIQAITHLDFGGPYALILFALTFPVSTAMIAILFNRAKKTGLMPLK